jgi:hypothetical protein
MFKWLFTYLWSLKQRRPGETQLEMAPVPLRQGRRYRATVTLSFTEQVFATNDMIKEMLTGAGFKDVTVKGDGGKRVAEGVWAKPDMPGALEPHLSGVADITPPPAASSGPRPA